MTRTMENYARLLVGMGCMMFVPFLGMVMATATDSDRFIVGRKSFQENDPR